MKTAYDVLGIPRNASNERIRTAFRRAAKACHPDLNSGDPTAELQIRQVITAYEILKIPHRRAAYDRRLRERRRERARHFATGAVASLVRGGIVALGVSLSVSQSNPQDAFAPPTPHSASAYVRSDERQNVAAADKPDRQEVNKEPKSDSGADPDYRPLHHAQTAGSLSPTADPPELYAALTTERGSEASGEPMASAGHAHQTELARSPSSNSLKIPSLEERATTFVPSQEDGHNHSRTVKVTAHQHRYNGRITSDESPSDGQRGGKSNRRASVGSRQSFVLPRGPIESLVQLVSQTLTAKPSSAHRPNVYGAGGRAGSYKTQQIAASNRAEAPSEKQRTGHRIRNMAFPLPLARKVAYENAMQIYAVTPH